MSRAAGWYRTVVSPHFDVFFDVLLGVSVTAAATAAVLPAMRYQRGTSALVTVTALALVGSAIIVRSSTERSQAVALLLLATSLAWSAPDLAVSGLSWLDGTLDRTTLVHLTLICAALCIGADALAGRATRGALLLAAATGASAGIGGHQVLLPVLGLVLLAGSTRSRMHGVSVPLLLRVAAGGLGSTLLLAAWFRLSGRVGAEAWLGPLHATAVAAAGLLLGLGVRQGAVEGAVTLASGGLESLEGDLARLLAVPAVLLTFPDEVGGWLDVRGRVAPAPGPAATPVVGGPDSDVVAFIEGTRAPLPRGLQDVLRLVRDNARLQASAAAQLDELKASQRRLLVVGDAERTVLGEQLRSGAIARVESIVDALRGVVGLESVRSTAIRTRNELEQAALGLDPLTRGVALRDVLASLTASTPNAVELQCHGEPDEAERRTVWFVCAEAVANATKHAPGASVQVTVNSDASGTWVEVSDDGPGGAQLSGSGLTGLADRAQALGGCLQVTSSSGAGTTVQLTLPRTGREGLPS